MRDLPQPTLPIANLPGAKFWSYAAWLVTPSAWPSMDRPTGWQRVQHAMRTRAFKHQG
jgi:hypothetical protein